MFSFSASFFFCIIQLSNLCLGPSDCPRGNGTYLLRPSPCCCSERSKQQYSSAHLIFRALPCFLKISYTISYRRSPSCPCSRLLLSSLTQSSLQSVWSSTFNSGVFLMAWCEEYRGSFAEPLFHTFLLHAHHVRITPDECNDLR